MLVLVDAAQPRDAHAAKAHHPRIAQEEDVGGGPPAVEQLPQVVGGLVVAADCKQSIAVRGELTRNQAKQLPQAVGGAVVAANCNERCSIGAEHPLAAECTEEDKLWAPLQPRPRRHSLTAAGNGPAHPPTPITH